jgi:lipid-A-disaccharide synthase
VVYKGNSLSIAIARLLVKIRFISLVNLIMDKEVVKELIQHDLTPENITAELRKILTDSATLQRMKDDYSVLAGLLSEGGNASKNAAEIIFYFVSGE